MKNKKPLLLFFAVMVLFNMPEPAKDPALVDDFESYYGDGGLLKGLWELPLVEPGPGQTQVFSHFRLELDTVRAIRADAQFRRPHEVPLATSTRKILAACGLY